MLVDIYIIIIDVYNEMQKINFDKKIYYTFLFSNIGFSIIYYRLYNSIFENHS